MSRHHDTRPIVAGDTVVLEGPLFSAEVVGDLLTGTGLIVEERPRPWAGDDVVGLLVWQRVDEADMARLPNLRAVVTGSVGFDHIDLDAASRRRLWVCHVPDYCLEEMADTTIALLLALLRGTVALDRTVRQGRWDDHGAGPLGRISDTRLGIVGFGRIGRAVATRALALGIETWATDPELSEEVIASFGVTPATLEQLLRNSTAVSLHLPLTRETEHVIGMRELALMPQGSCLINTARGPLVDLSALTRALESNHLAGAALDVLPVEPPTAAEPAPAHPRLIVTPHAGWYSPTSEVEVVRRAALAMKAIVEGREPPDAIVRGKFPLD